MAQFYKIRGYDAEYVFEMDHSLSKKKWLLSVKRNLARMLDQDDLNQLDLKSITGTDVSDNMKKMVNNVESAIKECRADNQSGDKDDSDFGAIVGGFNQMYLKSMKAIAEEDDAEDVEENSSNGVTITSDKLGLTYSTNHYDNVIAVNFFVKDILTGEIVNLADKKIITLEKIIDKETGTVLERNEVCELLDMGEMWGACHVEKGVRGGSMKMIFKKYLVLNKNIKIYDENKKPETKYWE